MTDKKLFVVAAFFCLIQLHGTAASPTAGRDLETTKNDASKRIQKSYEDFLADYKDKLNYTENAFQWVAGNEVFTSELVEFAKKSFIDIERLADKLVKKGKTENKTKEYFECIEKHLEEGAMEIEIIPEQYLLLMKPFQEEAIHKIEFYLSMMEKIFAAVEAIYPELIQKVNSCEDEDCVKERLKDAEMTFASAGSVLEDSWHHCVGAFLNFRRHSRALLTQSETNISVISKRTENDMKNC